MQIIFKVKEGCFDDAREAVENTIAALLPAGTREATTLRQMFPGVRSGRRSGLCVLDLPDDLTAERLQRVLRALESDAAIEYAELPAAKGPT